MITKGFISEREGLIVRVCFSFFVFRARDGEDWCLVEDVASVVVGTWAFSEFNFYLGILGKNMFLSLSMFSAGATAWIFFLPSPTNSHVHGNDNYRRRRDRAEPNRQA